MRRGSVYYHSKHLGFTIVELLIVVVVIAVLAAIIMVSFNGITTRASAASAQASIDTVVKKVEVSKIESSAFPLTLKSVAIQGVGTSDTRIEYTSDGKAYCVTASSVRAKLDFYRTSDTGTYAQGTCDNHLGYEGGAGIYSASSIFGASPPTGGYQVYDDSGGGVWTGNRFYTYKDNGVRVVGLRVWEPVDATPAFLTQSIDARVYMQDWQGADLLGWNNLGPVELSATYNGTRTAGTWTYVWFTGGTTIAKTTSSPGPNDMATVAVKYWGGSYDGDYYVAANPPLVGGPIESNQDPEVYLSEDGEVGRSVSNVYPSISMGIYYGIDLLFTAL